MSDSIHYSFFRELLTMLGDFARGLIILALGLGILLLIGTLVWWGIVP